MMEQNPGITFGEIRERLIGSLSEQANQKIYGYGKLDRAAVQSLFAED